MEEDTMPFSGYFQFLNQQLSEIRELAWDRKFEWDLKLTWDRMELLKLLEQDVEILEVFCRCLETWKYSIDEDNEESVERLSSVITSLRAIWPEDFTLLSLPINQYFDSVMFELEGMILQSKRHVEGWCRYWIHSSMMQCKSSESSQILYFLTQIREKLDSLRERRNSVPLKRQNDILRDKIFFLERKLNKVLHCPDGKEILPFMNFIGDFANSVVCLTCLYWAKEDDDETASEMNIVSFDIWQKFIPYASHIIPLYIGILKAYVLKPMSGSFLLDEAVVSFVDFFFKHMATVLKDDFLFLRDRVLFLFTFLTDPPCENAEGGDLINSQIYATMHEDVYLLMSFHELNKDFSEKKALLSGFMTRIDIANAKIRQLYYGSSDFWITMEVEKMEYCYFVSIQRELYSIETRVDLVPMNQLQLYRMELSFLRLFILWLATWDYTHEEIKVKLTSIISSLRGIWGEKVRLLAHRLVKLQGKFQQSKQEVESWHTLAFELQGKIQQSKQEVEAWCVNMFHPSIQIKTSTSYKNLKFLDSIIDNLNDLVNCKASEIVPFKKQIETLEEKLIFLKIFLKLALNCKYFEELEEFNMFVQAFANDAACLAFLYCNKEANAKSASETNSMLSHLLQKIKPTTPDVARLYFGTLMAIYAHRSDAHMFGQLAFSFVNLLLEDLVNHLKDDDFQILQDNIVCLLTFLNDPPNQSAEELICSQIDVLFREGLYGLIPFDDMEEGFSKKKMILSDFMLKIEAINVNIRRIYGKFPDPSLYNFPKVISPLFLDFLIQNLRNLKDRMVSDRKYATFAKYRIIKIEEELVSLYPFFIHFFDLQSEEKETWLEVVNIVHLTERVIMSCISSWFVFDHPIWYHMAYLSDVFDEIKVVKEKLEKIKKDIIYNARCLPSSDGFIRELAEQDSPSEINEIVVGFEHEAEEIIGMLTRGPKSLDIISVVGMGGLGKTTLAKKVYRSSSGKSEFHVFAFCTVSQDPNSKRLLFDILRDIGVAGITNDMTSDDLADKLKKCLSHRKYLIVLDDVWDVSAWNEVRNSFPDHENGSRIMFTTRSSLIADKCRIHCSPFQLRFMNKDEGWELLRKKVFRNGISPPYLYEIGKEIVKNCKGLPLAVAVIGGLLARTEESLRWWSEVAQRLAYYLSNEGCMDILELSYKHLPENLKTCLIYLGAFPEDCVINVKQVILLWIAEGFVQESKTQSLEDVAKGYFQDLVARSFIIIGAKSSGGGIKTFRLHDLIREFCQTKCRDGNFLHLNNKIASSSSDHSINNHYRVSTQMKWDATVAVVDGSPVSNARSVHNFGNYSEGLIEIPLEKFGLVQVFVLHTKGQQIDINQLTSLIHLRHIDFFLNDTDLRMLPISSSISNLWNITSLMLRLKYDWYTVRLPETFWRMKSLRHVKVDNCIPNFSYDDDNISSDQIMEKVVSFSKPILYTGKDVKRLLQRLPVVRELSCSVQDYDDYDEGSIETLDFDSELLESLKIYFPIYSSGRQYMINYPSTLKKLTLFWFPITWTVLSAIAELHCLQVLKLKHGGFRMDPILETEDLVFQNLKFFRLIDDDLKEWNASVETFPCLEQLEIECKRLKELPPCFGEISTFKRIALQYSSRKAGSSAHTIQEELMEIGIQLQLSIR